MSLPDYIEGELGRTYIAHNGEVFHRSMHGWFGMTLSVAAGVLAGHRGDARNTADWWHPRAAELADELESAMREAGYLSPKRRVA